MAVNALPAADRYQVLPRPARSRMDTLRLIAYRAQLRLARLLAPHPAQPETAQQVLREAPLASEASLQRQPASRCGGSNGWATLRPRVALTIRRTRSRTA